MSGVRLTAREVAVHLDRNPHDELVTLKVAAARVGVPYRTAQSWARNAHLPVLRIDGKVHVLMSHAAHAERATRTSGMGRPRRAGVT